MKSNPTFRSFCAYKRSLKIKMYKQAITVCCLLLSLALVNGMMNSLKEKTVFAKRPIDQQCIKDLLNTNKTLMERCEFFKCFEERFPCGEDYWILNWGYKYCRRYADPEFTDKFTANGRAILQHINKCLPNSLKKFYMAKRSIKCKKLNQEAFEAQGKCYSQVQKEFCVGFPENKDHFMNVLDQKDFINMESIKMIRDTADKCEPKIDLYSLMG
jgi:hypothetical protein